MPSKAYTIDEEGRILFFRLEWGVRQYKSFTSLPEAEGHLKTLVTHNSRALDDGYRITCHTIEVVKNVGRSGQVQI